MPTPRDDDIVARINTGDTEAFNELFHVYWAPLCTFVSLITRDLEEGREIVADLFATLWARRAEWRITGSIEAYLFVSARHRALTVQRDTLRRQQLLQSHLADTSEPSIPPSLGDSTTDPSAIDLRLTLDTAIAALPERHQTALYLRWRRDLAYEDIAIILGTTPGAVKKLINRATAALRDSIRDDPRL